MKLRFAVLPLTALVTVTVLFSFTPVPWWLTEIDLRHVTSSGIPISPDKQLEAVEAVRDRFLKIAAGIGALGTLVFTGLSFVEARKLNLINRYSSATEKLGAATPADRVGGIYALEQLAREDAPSYYAPVVDVLAAFVRAHTREGEAPAAPPSSLERGKERPASDVQAALTVLGRRSEELAPKEYDSLRFSDCTLRGANLRRANLRGVRFRRADLKDVRFEEAHLEGAELGKAHLEGAHLEGAHLEGAELDGARLEGAHLARAKGSLKLDKTTGKVHCSQQDSCSAA